MMAVEEMRKTRQTLRNKAAEHARLYRKHEVLANKSTSANWRQLYMTQVSIHHAQYRAFKWASHAVFHATRRVKEEMRRHEMVSTLKRAL